jgi:hypothetical protein
MMVITTDMAVEIFATNVEDPKDAFTLFRLLKDRFPGYKVNFDLQDKDRILRVEGPGLRISEIIQLVKENGFCCDRLE